MWLGAQSKSCPTLYLVIVSAIISGILDVCVSSSSVHDGGRVPCAELPEFAYLTNVPTIYGSCRRLSAEAITAQSAVTNEHWITVWKQGITSSSLAALSRENIVINSLQHAGAGYLTSAACSEGFVGPHGRFNATCTHTYSATVQGFTASFSRIQLARYIQAYGDGIESISLDSKVSIQAQQNTTDVRWGLDRIDQPSQPLDGLFQYYNLGSGVHAYIIDTGIRTSHSDFLFLDDRNGSRADEVYTTQAKSGEGEDCEGHGTHVAGVLGGLTYGVAKNVSLHAVRILDCMGDGTVSDVIAALDWLVQNAQHPAVAVMSLGGGIQPALDAAVESATQAGIHVIVAAGNNDDDACKVSPARTPSAITVAASDTEDKRLWLARGVASNYGPCVDLFAPGKDILSASSTGDTLAEMRTGTSQAVPFVAGVLSLILENRTDVAPATVASLLESNAAQGQLEEPQKSGYSSLAAINTPNLLLQSNIQAPLMAKPQQLQVSSGLTASLPFTLVLSQQPQDTVMVEMSVLRGTISPPWVSFAPSKWTDSIPVVYYPSPFETVDSGLFPIQIKTSSQDLAFDDLEAVVMVNDSKGEVLSYPKVITSLPFVDNGSTTSLSNDYVLSCNSGSSPTAGKDVAYYFKPSKKCTVTVSLCDSASMGGAPFDTQLFVLADVDDGGSLKVAACNDNGCGPGSNLSSVEFQMMAGVGYGFIIDGAAGVSGAYKIRITAMEGAIEGQLPPSSLLTSKTRVVASTQPAASATLESPSMVSIPGSDLYWAVGAWGDCSQDCIQTRLVACYFKSGDGSGSPTSTQESQCLESGTAKPVAARSCEPDECAVNTEGVLRRNLPLIVGLATGMGVLVALSGILLWYIKHRRSSQRKQESQQQFGVGGNAALSIRTGGIRRSGSAVSTRNDLLKAAVRPGSAGTTSELMPSPKYITVHAADYVHPGTLATPSTCGQPARHEAAAGLPPPPRQHLQLQQHVLEVQSSPSFGQTLRQRSPRRNGEVAMPFKERL